MSVWYQLPSCTSDNSLQTAPELRAGAPYHITHSCTFWQLHTRDCSTAVCSGPGLCLFQLSFSPAFLSSSLLIFFFHHKHPVTCGLLKWIWQPRGTSQLGWKECFWPCVGSLNIFLPFYHNTSILWYTGAHIHIQRKKWNEVSLFSAASQHNNITLGNCMNVTDRFMIESW